MRIWLRLACSGMGLGIGFVGLSAPAQVGNPGQLIQSLDANNDGTIDKGEVPESAHPQFEKVLKLADTNKDGKLDRDELRTMARKLRDAGPAMRKGDAAPAAAGAGNPQQRFKQMDKDGDGKVSKSEFTGPEALFDRLDADKDGSISKDELPKPGAGPGTGGGGEGKSFLLNRLKGMDKDGDGKVAKSEFTGVAENFDRMDRDQDGSLSTREIEAAADLFAANFNPSNPAAAKGKGAAKNPAASGEPGVFVAPRFKQMDKDGDGKVTKDEFTGPAPAFGRMDKDGDGSLTMDEMRAFAATKGQGKSGKTP